MFESESQRAYFHIKLVDIKVLMILKNVLLCVKIIGGRFCRKRLSGFYKVLTHSN